MSSGGAESATSDQAHGSGANDGGRRVVVVAEFVDPTKNSTGYYWHKTIKGLAEAGQRVVVVSTQASIRQAQPVDSVHWQPIPSEIRYNNDVVPLRIIGQFRLALSLAMTARAQLRRGDVLFCGTNPPFLLVMLGLLRRWGSFRLVMLVHDVFPENAVAAGLVSDKAPHFHLFKWIYDRTYERADALIAIGRDMVDTLRAKTRGRTAIHYVSNWVDAAEIATRPTPDQAPLVELLPGQTLFQYFGNLGRVQGLDLLLAAIAKVKHPSARFVFIGSGAMTEQVRAFAAADPQGRVRLLPPLTLQRNNEGLLACDVALITLAPGMKGLAVPSKAYFSMAADKPILVVGDPGTELEFLLREQPGVGWHCRSGDSDALARQIDAICEDDLRLRAGRPRQLVERAFDRDQAIRAYLPILLNDAR